MERMKKLGMSISRAEAAELASQSKTALMQRLHEGGTDMPPFPHLSEPEVRAIFAYLKQLAAVPGAEKQQSAVVESRLRVGEHIVKSTCHICHNAAGPNPNPEQLLKGAIPPLNTLTNRTSLPDFDRKIRAGAPILMGTPPSLFRGRMPVFYYLSADEVGDAYLYLKLFPLYETHQQNQAANNVVPGVTKSEPTMALPPSKGSEMTMAILPVAAEIFVALLMAGGLGFTVREVRRLSSESEIRKAFEISDRSIVLLAAQPAGRTQSLTKFAPSDDVVAVMANDDDKQAVSSASFHGSDYRIFESSWLARQLEKEDHVA
jgi:mono/diheme cytochrome c family protein